MVSCCNYDVLARGMAAATEAISKACGAPVSAINYLSTRPLINIQVAFWCEKPSVSLNISHAERHTF